MARKIKPADPRPKTGFRSTPFKVVAVAYGDAAGMLTVDSTNPIWGGGQHLVALPAGAFVRLRPPPGVEPAVVERLKQIYLKSGALAVRVVPAAQAEALPTLADKPAAQPHRTIREVVTAMVAETNSQDREALAALVESVISKEGI